jgi:heterotetrameric sarcosine oxidase gamma subunit
MHELAPITYRRSLDFDWTGLGNASVSLTPHEPKAAVVIKGSRRGDFASFVERELQAPASSSIRAHQRDDLIWLWQGPYEWLLISAAQEGAALAARFTQKLTGLTAAALDVTDRTGLLEISGPAAAALLARGTSLDLQSFVSGTCCRTRFANLPATIFMLGDPQAYGLAFDRASRVHLYTWLSRIMAGARF